MSVSSKARAWTVSGCAAISLIAFSASARAEVLFDSLDSPNTGVSLGFNFGATFATGASTFHATDIALPLDQPIPAQSLPDDDTFTVSLHGGIPLADVTFDPNAGLSVTPNQGPVLDAVTLPMSDLSTSLTVEHFNQFASIPLQPNSLYWIDLTATSASIDDAAVNWGFTSDVSGVGVAQNYNSSNATDFDFFLNQGVSPFKFDFAFQMKVSGTAVPEPSTWALMLAGFGGLGLLVYRRRAALGSSRA
jgi:hypothetical protein